MDDKTRFNRTEKPTWCPGCGDFGVQNSIKKAMLKLDIEPHRVLMSSGIGCSGKMPHWVHLYGFHGLHGRALPLAQGAKLANKDLVVLALGGDGDGYSEGMGHLMHACRRNVDITYLVHNNGVFGLTTGQVSPTAAEGTASSTTPFGALERPFNPLALAIAAGANFVARGFCGDLEHLSDLIVQGVRHPGFALIDMLQVCVTFNPTMSYKWYKERVEKIDGDEHDATDKNKAMAMAMRGDDDRLPIGVFYRGEAPTHESGLPQLDGDPLVEHAIDDIDVSGLMKEFV